MMMFLIDQELIEVDGGYDRKRVDQYTPTLTLNDQDKNR
jgi:hypothetical protein